MADLPLPRELEIRWVTERLWILGAPDPEMEMIEQILTECGEPVAYAVDERGERVHGGNAYRPAGAVWGSGQPVDIGVTLSWTESGTCRVCSGIRLPVSHPDYQWATQEDIPTGHDRAPIGGGMSPCGDLHRWDRGTVGLVECALPAAGVTDGSQYIETYDHHRPGDPGYGRPPAEFLASSSIGQVISELARLQVLDVEEWEQTGQVASHQPIPQPGVFWRGKGGWSVSMVDLFLRVPRTLLLAAAADHCLGAAYRGECPGVDPDELMRWRVETRAAFQGRPAADILADIGVAREELERAGLIELVPREEAGQWLMVRDMRRDTPIPELPEAATRDGVSYVSGPLIGPDGRHKYTCSGTPEVVRAFIEHWAPAQGLVDVYGDPARGFAGGYACD